MSSRLGQKNTPTANLLRGKTPNECPSYDTRQSDGEVPVMQELGEMPSTPFIAIAPWSNLARRGSI